MHVKKCGHPEEISILSKLGSTPFAIQRFLLLPTHPTPPTWYLGVVCKPRLVELPGM